MSAFYPFLMNINADRENEMQNEESQRQPGDLICKKKFTITNKLGLHARPAALFVKLAKTFASDILIQKGREKVDGKSIMGLMTLAAGPGSKITVTVQGHDAEQALAEIAKLFECNFGE